MLRVLRCSIVIENAGHKSEKEQVMRSTPSCARFKPGGEAAFLHEENS